MNNKLGYWVNRDPSPPESEVLIDTTYKKAMKQGLPVGKGMFGEETNTGTNKGILKYLPYITLAVLSLTLLTNLGILKRK